ncbi:MAG: acyl carrier protein [Subdoligranulum sp.]|nr:acyl carrier protein [Subdoligranulum sp.]MCI7542260.1 acyl carrier protein [Subdoligranulum sp.]MDD7266051.1 acyl carrier protein [Subdoligranulum sp.]MDY5922863.1 acyl carrier protein [Oscillospiraceae bacterium]
MDTQIFEKIRDLLAEQLDIPADSITPESDIIDDLEADSLTVLDMVMTLEDEFDIEIPDEDVEKLRTVGSVVSYVEDHT